MKSYFTNILFRDPNFDLNTLEMLRGRIMELREKRGIGTGLVDLYRRSDDTDSWQPLHLRRSGLLSGRIWLWRHFPKSLYVFVHPGIYVVLDPYVDSIKAAHWAQQIFSLPLPSRTTLKSLKKHVARTMILCSGPTNTPL